MEWEKLDMISWHTLRVIFSLDDAISAINYRQSSSRWAAIENEQTSDRPIAGWEKEATEAIAWLFWSASCAWNSYNGWIQSSAVRRNVGGHLEEASLVGKKDRITAILLRMMMDWMTSSFGWRCFPIMDGRYRNTRVKAHSNYGGKMFMTAVIKDAMA